MPNKTFLAGQERLILVALLLVFVVGVIVFPRGSLTGAQIATGAPAVTIDHWPAYPVADTALAITATASSKVSSVIRQIDIFDDTSKSSRKTCKDATSCTLTTGYKALGYHYYVAEAKDENGKTGKSSVKKMLVAPKNSFTSLVVANDAVNKRVSIAWTKPTATFGFYRLFQRRCGEGEASWLKKTEITSADKTRFNNRSYSFTGLTSGQCYEFKAVAMTGDPTFTTIAQTTTPEFVTAAIGAADSTPPTLSVSYSVPGKARKEPITLTATAYDSAGFSSIQLWTEKGMVKLCTDSPCTYTETFDTGAHYYYAIATDKFGNTVITDTKVLTVRGDITKKA